MLQKTKQHLDCALCFIYIYMYSFVYFLLKPTYIERSIFIKNQIFSSSSSILSSFLIGMMMMIINTKTYHIQNYVKRNEILFFNVFLFFFAFISSYNLATICNSRNAHFYINYNFGLKMLNSLNFLKIE
jgi:hypothetical protein